jgi:hypothetical protein
MPPLLKKERMVTPVPSMTGIKLLSVHWEISSSTCTTESCINYTSPSALWAKLLEKYRVPRLSKNYVDFKAIMDLKIPNHADPSPFFDQMAALFLRLKQNDLEIPKKLRVMIILSKMPPVYEAMGQIGVIAGEDGNWDPNQLMLRLRSAYDTGNRAGGGNKPQHANKVSVVKPAPNQPPHF